MRARRHVVIDRSRSVLFATVSGQSLTPWPLIFSRKEQEEEEDEGKLFTAALLVSIVYLPNVLVTILFRWSVHVSSTLLVLNALVSELSHSLRGGSLSSPNYCKQQQEVRSQHHVQVDPIASHKKQYIQSDTEQEVFTKLPRPRYARYRLDIIKALNYQAYKTYRKIRNSYKKEEFSRNYEKVIQGFYRKYNKKRKGGLGLNRSFTTVKKNN